DDKRVVSELALLLETARQDSHDLVAVNDGAGVVNSDAAIRITVEGDPKVGFRGHGDGLELFGIRRATGVVDVAAVRRRVDDNDFCTSLAKCERPYFAGGAVGAVDGDTQALQWAAHGRQKVIDVAPLGTASVIAHGTDV